jgi:hypothetical protein
MHTPPESLQYAQHTPPGSLQHEQHTPPGSLRYEQHPPPPGSLQYEQHTPPGSFQYEQHTPPPGSLRYGQRTSRPARRRLREHSAARLPGGQPRGGVLGDTPLGPSLHTEIPNRYPTGTQPVLNRCSTGTQPVLNLHLKLWNWSTSLSKSWLARELAQPRGGWQGSRLKHVTASVGRGRARHCAPSQWLLGVRGRRAREKCITSAATCAGKQSG